MSHVHHCPHCRASLPAPRSRLLGKMVVGVAWTLAMAMVLVLTPFIFAFPFLFAGGLSMITAAHEWAFADWTCHACGKLIEREPVRVRTRPLAAAHAA